MTKRAWTRTSNVSARLLAMSSVALALFVCCVGAEASLVNFISISTSCAANVDKLASGATGPVVNSNSFDFDCSTACSFDFSLPVIFGTPMLLDIKLVGSAGAATFSGVLSSSLDMSQSIYWDGIQSVTFDGQPVAYSLTSASGHDWTQS